LTSTSMTTSRPFVEKLVAPAAPEDLEALAGLLVSAVERGAAVSFVLPLPLSDARQWWQRTLDAKLPRGVILVARVDGRIIGTVSLQPAWAPNQPHRADVAKLLVHPDWQRRSVGALLMQTLEDFARRAGFTLLTLDAKAGSAAERLYRRLGWTLAGTIPQFARDPDGPMHDAVVMYKALDD
jgi:acetyltransferase